MQLTRPGRRAQLFAEASLDDPPDAAPSNAI